MKRPTAPSGVFVHPNLSVFIHDSLSLFLSFFSFFSFSYYPDLSAFIRGSLSFSFFFFLFLPLLIRVYLRSSVALFLFLSFSSSSYPGLSAFIRGSFFSFFSFSSSYPNLSAFIRGSLSPLLSRVYPSSSRCKSLSGFAYVVFVCYFIATRQQTLSANTERAHHEYLPEIASGVHRSM